MHDEGADHAHHFLHRHVRVVEIRAFLVQREFVDKSATGRDRVLTRTGRSVHLVRDFEAVPVHRCRFGKVVVHDDPNAITLVHLNRWPWSIAVVTPEVNDPAGKDLLFDRLGDEMEFLNAPVHAARKLRNVRRFHRNDPTVALCTVAHVVHVHTRSVRLRRCKQARCGRQTGTQTKSISQEITSVLHGSSSLRLGGPNCPEKPNGHWIEETYTAKQSTRSRCCGYTVARRRGGNSNAKDGKRRSTCRESSRWAAVQTPCDGELGGQKLGRGTQDDGTAPDHRHLRNNFSPNVEAFRRNAVRLTRLRHQHCTHGLTTWIVHG